MSPNHHEMNFIQYNSMYSLFPLCHQTNTKAHALAAIVNVIVIDFTIGHNQLYIRQNGNTIWTYLYSYLFH